MSNSLKFTLAFGLLAAIGMTGCDKGSTNQAATAVEQAATEVEQAATAVEQAASSVSTDSAGTSGNATGGADAAKPKNPIDMIKERLKPENIGPTLDDAFASFQSEIGKLNDPAKATEVVPKLKQMLEQFNMMSAMAPMVPPESREVIVDRISAGIGPMQSAIDKLYENEEVKAIVQPTLDQVMEKFTSLKTLFSPAPPVEDSTAADEAPSEDADAAVE